MELPKKVEQPKEPVQKQVEKPVEKPVAKPIEKPVEKPVVKPVEKPVEKKPEQHFVKPVEKPVNSVMDKTKAATSQTNLKYAAKGKPAPIQQKSSDYRKFQDTPPAIGTPSKVEMNKCYYTTRFNEKGVLEGYDEKKQFIIPVNTEVRF